MYYKVKLWLVPPKFGEKVWKSQGLMVVGVFPRAVSRPKTKGAAGPGRVLSSDFLWGSIRRYAQYSGTAHVRAAQRYSNCVCSTVVQYLGVQYSGTALVCAVEDYLVEALFSQTAK